MNETNNIPGTTTYPRKKLPVSELQLADVVQLSDDDYATGTVVQVTEDEVHVYRPYVHTADFSYTGGVIPYIGTETVKLYRKSSRELFVWSRTVLK